MHGRISRSGRFFTEVSHDDGELSYESLLRLQCSLLTVLPAQVIVRSHMTKTFGDPHGRSYVHYFERRYDVPYDPSTTYISAQNISSMFVIARFLLLVKILGIVSSRLEQNIQTLSFSFPPFLLVQEGSEGTNVPRPEDAIRALRPFVVSLTVPANHHQRSNHPSRQERHSPRAAFRRTDARPVGASQAPQSGSAAPVW